MSDPIEVRALDASHVPAYRALMLRAYAEAPDAFTSTVEDRAGEPDSWWLKRIADPQGLGLALGAFHGGRLVGTVALEFTVKPKTRHKALLIGMFVEADCRGLGAGRALVRAALARAAARDGVSVVGLTVTQGNTAALRLYRSCGFDVFGVEPLALRMADGLRGRVHMSRVLGGDGAAAGAGAASATIAIPTLETRRLRLEPPSAACAALYEAFYTDAEASRTYGGPLTPGAAWARLASDLGSWQLQGFGVWALCRRDAGEHGGGPERVGACGFWQGRGWPRELTWWLLPSARGQGLAYEASIAAARHAYEVFGWSTVETYMDDANAPARALVAQLGGVRVDRRAFPDGRERDVFRIPPPDPRQG